MSVHEIALDLHKHLETCRWHGKRPSHQYELRQYQNEQSWSTTKWLSSTHLALIVPIATLPQQEPCVLHDRKHGGQGDCKAFCS